MLVKPRNRMGSVNTPFRVGKQAGWREYSQRKQEWIEKHPEASYREIDAAARRIARDLGL